MKRQNFIGAILFVALFTGTFMITDVRSVYFNGLALVVVMCGTLGAAFLSFPYARIKNAVIVAKNACTAEVESPDRVVKTLLDFSVRSKIDGLLSLENAEHETTVSFLKNALGLVVDNYPEGDIRDILTKEMYFFKMRRRQLEGVFRSMAKTAPAFGVAGSVIGLIGMLAGLGDTAVILKTIPLALTSTLYGILASNFVFIPAAESVACKTQDELLIQKMILEGVVAIRNEQNPYRLEKRLAAFLTPADRADASRGFKEIRQKYLDIVKRRNGVKQADGNGDRPGGNGDTAKPETRKQAASAATQ